MTTVKYVLGFFFNVAGDKVLLINKKKPLWQSGKINGVGGKIESKETPFFAMVRELQEETGLGGIVSDDGLEPVVGREWLREFCILQGGDDSPQFEMHCFVGVLNIEKAISMEFEQVEMFEYPAILKSDKLMSNLRWLLPLSLDKDIKLARVLEVPSGGINRFG